MFKQHKTFDLAKERQPKKRDTFYQPKKSKYLKFILPPVLIAFFLLLILLNVDFDNEIYQIPQTNALLLVEEEASVGEQNLEMATGDDHNETIKNEKEIIENIADNEYKINQSSTLIWSGRLNIASKLAAAMKCETIIGNCSLICNDGSVSYVDESLEQLQIKCPNIDLALEMNRCEFYNGILKKTFFGGYFNLMYLAINQCNLQTIQDATFTHTNVKNLKTLKLTNNQLLMLQESTLAGLINIRHFEFTQFPLQKEFDGKDFVKAIATAVILIIQPSINSTVITDPVHWWPGVTLEIATHLDLSNTNLQNVLAAPTFVPFKALKTLILFNCNLHSLGLNTFASVADTLQSLDLRFNHLTTLDINFFYLMAAQNIKLQLELNEWFCECDFKLFECFESYNADMMEEIICHSPQEYYELDLKQLHVICQSSSSTSTTTPNITVPTTTTLKSTTVTTLDPGNTNQTTTTIAATSPTTTSSESSSTTTTLKPSSPISPPYVTSTSTTPKPIYSTTTTSRPIFTEKVTITCYKNIDKTDVFKTDIVKETLNFTIYTISSTSVRIEIPLNEQREAFTVLYFTNYNDSQSLNGYTLSSEAVTLKSQITIGNLQTSKVYLFCVIKDSSTAISPYDCQAHYLSNMGQNAWLLQQDKAWFLTTSILLALIVFLCTVFVVYCLIRRHPYWLLRRNERILQVHNRPNEVLVVSRKSTKETLSLNASPVSQRSSNYLKPLQPLRVNALCTAESSLYSSTLTVPVTKAPRSPPTCSKLKASDMKADLNRTKLSPTGCYMRKSKLDNLNAINEPIYQTIDHYEAVNF